MAAITPITIPAIAPPLRPPELECSVTGRVLPLAVAGGKNGTVVDAETVAVETPPLVGRTGAEYVLVTVGFGMAVYDQREVTETGLSVHWPAERQPWLLAQHIIPQDICGE